MKAAENTGLLHIEQATSQATGKAGGLRKPQKDILPVSLSRGTECSVSCITCPASRKRDSFHCVQHLFDIEYHPALPGTGSESLLLSPVQPEGVSLKQLFHKTGPERKLRSGPVYSMEKDTLFQVSFFHNSVFLCISRYIRFFRLL